MIVSTKFSCSWRRSVFLLLLVAFFAPPTFAQQCGENNLNQTPSDALGPFYVANSTLTSRVAPETMLADPTRRLEVKGRVLSTSDCNVGLADIVVEVWYAGEELFYQDDEYRGQVVTNECGEYSFMQTVPALYPSRPILHNHFRLSRSDGEQLLVTQMYFQGEGTGYVSSGTRPGQAVQIEQDNEGARTVKFDMYLNVEGDRNANCTFPLAVESGGGIESTTATGNSATVQLSEGSTSGSGSTGLSLTAFAILVMSFI